MADANQGAKIKLFWLDRSRAQRMVWLFEELNLKYDVEIFKRLPTMLAPKELKELHPLGKSPVITVQGPEADDKPETIAESGAIVEYITDHFGKGLVPPKWKEGKEGKINGETEEFKRYRYYMQYAEGSLMIFMVMALVMDQVKNPPGVPFFVKPIPRYIAGQVEAQFLNQNFKTHLEFLENDMAAHGGNYICGNELTAADIMMHFPLEAGGKRAGMTKEKHPRLYAYVERIQQREAYKRAIARIESETDLIISANPDAKPNPALKAQKKAAKL